MLFQGFLCLVIAISACVGQTPFPDWLKQVSAFNAFYAADDSGPIGDNGYPSTRDYPKGLYLPLIGNFNCHHYVLGSARII
jgi:hypothetical protein